MTFKQWCEMVYEKSCGKYPKGKKRVFGDRLPHQHDRLRVVVIHDHPRPKEISEQMMMAEGVEA